MRTKNVAIIQPEVPHYRTEFFDCLNQKLGVSDIYIYNSLDNTKLSGFEVNKDGFIYMWNKKIKNLLIYNPLVFFNKKYDTLVLMLHFGHITTWFLLLTKWLHGKKIILWGQGISVKRYLAEEKKPDWKLKLMIFLADGIWLYMKKEERQWRLIFPNKPIIALQNTLTGVNEMVNYTPTVLKHQLKEKYKIKEKTVLIFCARFESNYRRTDLLVETIQKLDNKKFGFIIIGKGKNKPDLSHYSNVYDFGAVFDTFVKRELFTIADMYFQPGWVGLSIVEAMAYGKPICTFKRSEDILQCVEYSYIEPLGGSDNPNGLIFENIEDCLKTFNIIKDNDIELMGKNARKLVRDNLTVENMVSKALRVLEQV